jgi:hypothetical protein
MKFVLKRLGEETNFVIVECPPDLGHAKEQLEKPQEILEANGFSFEVGI